MVEITASLVLQVVQTIALIVGIIYYITIMRNQQRTRELALESQVLARKAQEHALETRQAQLLMQMLNRNQDRIGDLDSGPVFNTKLSGLDEFLEKSENDENFKKVVRALFGFYEGLGVFVKQGYIDIHLVALMWGGNTRKFYENVVEPIIDDYIIHLDYPRLWSETVYLCKELIKYMEEHPELKT